MIHVSLIWWLTWLKITASTTASTHTGEFTFNGEIYPSSKNSKQSTDSKNTSGAFKRLDFPGRLSGSTFYVRYDVADSCALGPESDFSAQFSKPLVESFSRSLALTI